MNTVLRGYISLAIAFCIAVMPVSQGVINGQTEVPSPRKKSKIRRLTNKLRETWRLYQKKREQKASPEELKILEQRIRTIKRALIGLGVAAATIAAILVYRKHKKTREREEHGRIEEVARREVERRDIAEGYGVNEEDVQKIIDHFIKTYPENYQNKLAENLRMYKRLLAGESVDERVLWPDIWLPLIGRGWYAPDGYTYLKGPPLINAPSSKGYLERVAWWKEKFEDQSNTKQLVKIYKIHLMPQRKDLIKTAQTLLKTADIFDAADGIKVLGFLSRVRGVYPPPIIVLYAFQGKEQAQKVLDAVCRTFGSWEGMNITPRFNKRITSFIYFAQGDGNTKEYAKSERSGISPWEKYFTPDGVYYSKELNEAGDNPDYELRGCR